LAQRFGPFFPGGTFMIIEVNALNMNGIMPKPAWDWFYADHSIKRPTGWGSAVPQGLLPFFGQK
jgi:hypothetical protein